MAKENNYGLSEGVLNACKFLGLTFPPEVPENSKAEHVPSDYFGENFELSLDLMDKLQRASKLTKETFSKRYGSFTRKFFSQKPLKQNETNLNVYFCDWLLFARKTGATIVDYFDFEFYNKPLTVQSTFMLSDYYKLRIVLCNDPCSMTLLNNKGKTNEIFADFIHRDWIDTKTCTFEEFKNFAKKHRKFFSKPTASTHGNGAEIIAVDSDKNFKAIFAELKSRKSICEEIIAQHESLAAFCPDTVNTIRVNTILDVHNIVHILTTSGRFGRVGNIVDNFHGGGFSVTIDTKTGVIISDGLNRVHERVKAHPDTGKFFKGFHYPFWEKLRETVTEMAKLIPQLRHIGWDIAINSENEIVLVEANGSSAVDVQQAPDSVGRLYLYQPLIDELKKYKADEMNLLGWRVNNLRNLKKSYESAPSRHDKRLQLAVSKIVPSCKTLIDLGCRQSKFIKSICPKNVKYIPIDYENYGDDEIIVRNFNDENFLDIKADTCICAFTAEYVQSLPQFLTSICNAAQKQILMLCRPFDKEIFLGFRWENPFLTDFTEKYLIETMSQNRFVLRSLEYMPENRAVILYDFRKI